MIDDNMLEMASLYVLGDLQPEQSARFEAEYLGSAELQELVKNLQDDFASLALAAPVIPPPPGVKAVLLEQFRAAHTPEKIVRVSFVPWALAAALAVAATFFFLKQQSLQKQIVDLQSRDILAQTRVAVLQSQVAAFAGGKAIVMWDDQAQKGLVKFEKLPAQPGSDYQLWVLDPNQSAPVDAGLIPVTNESAGRVDFHPKKPVSKGSKFAISIERKGGSQTPSDQIIFVGE